MSHEEYLQKKIIKMQRRKVTMKLSELIDPTIGQALASLGSKEIGGKAAFKLAQIIEERKKHLLVFEAARKSIIDRFAVKNEDGTNKLTEDKSRIEVIDEIAFDKEFTELVAQEVEMPKIDSSFLENLSAVQASHLVAMSALIKV